MLTSSLNRANLSTLGCAVIVFAFALLGPRLSSAQERFPAVARISLVSGPVSYSRGDDPDEWDDAIENVPLTIGDRIYAPEDGRAELQLSSGNFVRLAPRSYFTALNLSDDIKQFYLGEGAASLNIRRLGSDEVIEIDTPNVSVTLDQPGRYRIAVDEQGNSRISVRGGRAIVAASGRQITVQNSEIRVYGIDSPRYEIVALPATDAFDRWAAERDDRFERAYSGASRYASEEIIGVEDLSDYGRWEQIPEYGYAWTPSRVAAGWAPFSVGHWFWQDPWGWTWISNERWGWATSHYGRWTPYRSRWYWVPVRPRTRVRYAPACVEFVRVRDHVGWFPLHPRDRHIPWWERRDHQRDHRHITYVNRTYVTVINHNHFVSARPVHRHIVRDSVIVQEARTARFASDSSPIPSRSSLRVVSENGGRHGHRPSANIINRAAVVRIAPPAPLPTFQEKLPHIQKSQGKPIDPSVAAALASQDDRAKAHRVRIRPAAEQSRGGDFAPRNPGANSGPAPQPLTEARGKKLATRENSGASNASETADRAQKTPAAQPAQPEPSKGTASRPEPPRLEQDRDRQRQEVQTPERQRQAQQQQQELERKKQAQQKEDERNSQLQKQQQEKERQQQEQKQRELERRQAQQKEEQRKAQLQKQPAQERRQEPQERQSPQQRLEEMERRQAQQREEENKAQLQQKQQEQERREQLRQQQLQERQTQQQRQQELQRRGQEQERKAQGLQQQQQEQARREQLRQQQLQERQAREQQRQQDPERRQQQQQREQDRNAQVQQRQEQAPAQQLRQQQMQEREAQQLQRQQEQRRLPQPRQPQLPGGQPPVLQRPPVQP